jgi:hypothetical protein
MHFTPAVLATPHTTGGVPRSKNGSGHVIVMETVQWTGAATGVDLNHERDECRYRSFWEEPFCSESLWLRLHQFPYWNGNSADAAISAQMDG